MFKALALVCIITSHTMSTSKVTFKEVNSLNGQASGKTNSLDEGCPCGKAYIRQHLKKKKKTLKVHILSTKQPSEQVI